MVLTVIVFLVVLSVLVLVHELGHLVVGKMAGVGVLEFALGLPFTRSLWSRKLRSGMKISLYPVLFGGFVKLLGEDSPSPETLQRDGVKGKYFNQVNAWKRMAVVVAGVTMNFLLAILLFYIFLFVSGFTVLVPKLADYDFASPHKSYVVVTFIQKNSPAEAAKMTAGDVLVSVDGKKIDTISDFQTYTKTRAGEEIRLTLTDTDFVSSRVVSVVPRRIPPAGQGPLGVGIDEGVKLSYITPGEKIVSGLTYSWDMLVYNLKVLGRLGSISVQKGDITPLSDNVSGPVGIAGAVSSILDLGGKAAAVTMLNFVGLLSLSLAFMNVLPIPALDGGRLAFLLVEALLGKKLAAEKENLVNQIGMIFLLGLIILISFNDVVRIISPLWKK